MTELEIMRKASFIAAAFAALVAFAPFAANANNPTLIEKFGDWEAYTYNAGDKAGMICYMGSIPTKAVGNYTSRGNIYVMVTHRPSASNNNEVSFVAGYTYRNDSEVDVKIGSRSYKLFTNEDSAWARDSKTDEDLVKAMRRGSTMTVKGTSTRGTLTTDTYSLKGFTAAYNAISERCGVRAVR
jgi:hypothetical protein